MEHSPLHRALDQAPTKVVSNATRAEQEFFCFRLGELRLGVPSKNVREVARTSRITALPRIPAFILGVTAHRGEVLPVIDLLRFLGKGESRVTARSRIFIGIYGPNVAGFLADSVIGLRKIASADILPPPLGGDAAAEHLLGVLQDESGTLNLLTFGKLIQAAKQRAVVR